MTYNEIVSKYPGAENMNSVGNELFYDGLPAIKEKCKYVVDNKLGGVMFWELSGDAVYGGKSLLKCINESLGR